MAEKEVKYKISLEDKFNYTLNKSSKNVSTFEKKILNVGKLIGGIFAGRIMLKSIGNTAKLFDKQSQAIAQVEAGLKSTGGTVGRTLDQLTKDASKLQDETIFGDEEILKGVTSQLLTFTNVTESQFDRTQRAALDLASRIGVDLKSASIQLGKALNDPIANLSALSRSGIQFSKKQKEVIKTLAESGRLADAQNIILTELERQYGGSAAAARKAGLGGFKALKNTFGDLQEVIGERLIKSTGNLSDRLNTLTKGLIGIVKVPISETLRKTRFELNAEFNLLKRGNITAEQRSQLIKDINTKYKDYLPNLLNEKSSLQDIEEAQKAANNELLKRIEIQAKQEILEEAINKAAKANKKLFESQLELERIRLDLQNENSNIRREAARQELGILDQIERRQKKSNKRNEELLKLQESLGDFSKMQQSEAAKIKTTAIPSPELAEGITAIKAAAPKTFNINISKLNGVENFTNINKNLAESSQDIGKAFTDVLLSELADLQAVS
jgi:hypothetical protein